MSSNDVPENGQTVNSGKYNWIKQHREMNYIEAPVVCGQLHKRACVTRNIALSPKPDNDRPTFMFKGADHFKIIDLRVLTKFPVKSNEMKADLLIVICYDLIYDDGQNELVQPDSACFILSTDPIKCPSRAVKHFQKNYMGSYSSAISKEKSYFSAEALAQSFGEIICPETGALIIDLGVFFIIKSICITQLLVPFFLGYAPCREQEGTSVFKPDKKCDAG